MALFLLLFLPLLSYTKVVVSVQDAFAEAGIVEGLKIQAPNKQLRVSFLGRDPLVPGDAIPMTKELSGKRETGACENCGNGSHWKIGGKSPNLKFAGAIEGKLYTIAMVDLDPSSAQRLHWLLTNVEGLLLSHGAVGGPSTEVRDYQVTDGMKTLFSSRPSTDTVGDQVVAYEGPSPPRGSGPHRYVLLVWQQKGRVSMESPSKRTGGDISKIAKDLDLGHPVAGNFFLAEKKALTGDYQLEIAEKREALEEDIKKQELEVEMKKQALEEEIKKQALMEEDMRNQTQQEEMKGQAIGEVKKKK